MNNTARLGMDGDSIRVTQTTEFPWENKIDVKVNLNDKKKFSLKLRIPGWARNIPIPGDLYTFMNPIKESVSLKLNGTDVEYKMDKGYAVINRKWSDGDIVSLTLPMNPEVVLASDSIKADRDKMAVQRGPFMYAVEWPDVKDGNVLNLIFDRNQTFTVEKEPDLLNGIYAIIAKARLVKSTTDGGFEYGDEQTIKMIPYYSWNNRGPGEMAVWLPYNEKSVRPLPAPTIASKSKLSASHPSKSLVALNDQLLPESSIDNTWPFYHWWPKKNSWEWVQYDFDSPATVSTSSIYWFDDDPFGGCRIPSEWKILYKHGNKWIPVTNKSEYKIVKDDWCEVKFQPVKTSSLRLMVKLPKEYSAGIHEWVVE